MKKILLGLGILVLALALLSCRKKEPQTTCLFGDNIPEADLKPLLETSEKLVQLLEEKKYPEIYETGTEEMKSAQTKDQFVFYIEYFFKPFGALEFSRVTEAYLMSAESKDPQVKIPCNLGEPGVDDYYIMPPNRQLAVVIYEGKMDMEDIRVIFLLEKQGEGWRLRSLNLIPFTIKHYKADYYLNQAQQFRRQNLTHLAVLYYKTAILLSDLGLDVEPFTVRVIQAQMSQIKADYLPSGDVQLWSLPSDQTYKVYNVDTAYVRDEVKPVVYLLVHVSYMTASLEDKAKLEQQAREIAAFLDQKFPEYRRGFDGFRVTAASEKREEQLMAYHSLVLFPDLPGGNTVPVAPLPPGPDQGLKPVAPQPGPSPLPGATAKPAPAPGPTLPSGATARPAPAAPAQTPPGPTPPPPGPGPEEDEPNP